MPSFLRTVDRVCASRGLNARPSDWSPVRISSWIGGDRDGNPNVTAGITREVLLLAQWQACALLATDLANLFEELSITTASDALKAQANGALEPYRAILKPLRALITRQRSAIEEALEGQSDAPAPLQAEDILGPLNACRESLRTVGLDVLANGPLLDLSLIHI